MAPIVLRPHRSRSLDFALWVAHLLPALGLVPTVLPIPLKLALWLVLALSLFRLLRRQDDATVLTLKVDGAVSWERRGGQLEYRVDHATTVLPWFVVLRLRSESAIESLVLPVDALSPNEHRQLRTWLRWRATVEPA
ncbi:MAG TPA: protein YgfX [Rhodocyclaceae bacterium]|nr:protein YgfX [Rhodocyclaceae bacterium]